MTMKMFKHVLTILTSFLISFICTAQEQDSILKQYLSMDIEELINTKVSIATKTEQPVSESPSTVSVISSEEIKNTGARQLEDLLNMVPGFEVTRTYNGYYTVAVRGVKDSRTTSRVLILIDDNPINLIFYGDGIFYGHEINIDDIERIEIIRGPGSALYGRNAFSSVINIITKKAGSAENLRIKGSIGNYNTKILSAGFGFKGKNLSISMSAKNIITDFADEIYNNDKYYGSTKNLAFNSTIDFKKFNFSFMLLNVKNEINNSFMSKRPLFYTLSYAKALNPQISFNAKLYGNYCKYVEDIELSPPDSTYFLNGFYVKPSSKNYLVGFETDWNFRLFKNNSLLVGLQADMHGVYDVIITSNADSIESVPIPIPGAGRDDQVVYEPGWFENESHSYQNFALLLQDIWHPVKQVSITLGARYDYDSQIGSQINPRLGIVYNPFDNAALKLLYGRAYRAPTPSEQYVNFGFAVGNKDVKPEIINTFEAAFLFKYKNMTNMVSAYWNNVKDAIYAPLGTEINPDFKYHNIGKNTSTGIEYENKIIIGKNIYTFLNYSYSFSVNTITTTKADQTSYDSTYTHPDVAPHKLNLGINCRFLKYFNCNLNMLYRSKMDKFFVSDAAAGSSVEVQDQIGDYSIFNFTLRIENLVKHIELSTSVYNIFDTKYYSQDNQHLHQPSQQGRQFIFSLSYNL
jgi:outer membrane receptor protein involved in Fe transport